MRDGDVYPVVFPIEYIGGITMLVALLRAGGHLAMFDKWDPRSPRIGPAAHRPTVLGSA